MTGKEFLQHVLEVSHTLESKLEQFEQLQSIAKKITTVISGTPSVSDKSQSKIENAVVRALQESADIENAVTDFFALRNKATAAIANMPDNDEKLILEYRYLAGKSWAEIAKLMGLTLRYTYSLHGNALKNFEKFFETEDKKAQKSTNSTLTNTV